MLRVTRSWLGALLLVLAAGPASAQSINSLLPALAASGARLDPDVPHFVSPPAGGASAMQSLVDLAVAATNTAYGNSSVTQRIRLVYAGEIAYTEAGISSDLSRLAGTADGYMDTVHTLRNTYGADVVTLVGEHFHNNEEVKDDLGIQAGFVANTLLKNLHEWTVQQLGYLPPQELCYLLAAQVHVRGP